MRSTARPRIAVTLLIFAAGWLLSRESADSLQKVPLEPALIAPYSSVITAANGSMWVRNDGKSANSPTNRSGIRFPADVAGTVYQDGIVWGGNVLDGQSPDLRVGGQTHRIGTQPGNIVSSGVAATGPDSLYRVYRIRPDWQNLDPLTLLMEAATVNEIDTSQVTAQQIQEVSQQYQQDWDEWPVNLGAPFVDVNQNGSWDPGIDEPGIPNADQTIWFVCNDLDTLRTKFLYGSRPVGLEMQTTVWSFDRPGVIADAVFKRYRLIYKGALPTTPATARIENMYLSQWSDADIGNYIDDVVGCDTTRDLAFAYNGTPSDTEFMNTPPAYGYQLLQGPIMPSSGDTADFDFRRLLNFRNVRMSSFVYTALGSSIPQPNLGTYDGTIQWYKQLQGLQANLNDTPYIAGSGPNSGQATVFPLSGDPETGTGDVDALGNNLPSGDRIMALNAGPFNMALNDTQEVIIAALGNRGDDYLKSVTVLDSTADFLKTAYESGFDILTGISKPSQRLTTFKLSQNYPNPFNPETTISYELKQTSRVTLNVYNLLGQKVAALVKQQQTAGRYTTRWNGKNAAGEQVASGLYLYRLSTELGAETRKMMLLK
ncbi:MAG: T9SS type A sorting domain-containing protein [Calditrichia bacterium]